MSLFSHCSRSRGVREHRSQAAGRFEAIVLIAEGRTFSAGADLSEFGKPIQDPSLWEVLTVLDGCNRPVVAVMHGRPVPRLSLIAHDPASPSPAIGTDKAGFRDDGYSRMAISVLRDGHS